MKKFTLNHCLQKVILPILLCFFFVSTDAYGQNGMKGAQVSTDLDEFRTDSCVVVIDAEGFPISCFGGTSFAAVSAVGGDGDYSYLWSDPMGQTTSIALGLTAGMYSVTVSDTTPGCFRVDSVLITQPDSINAMFMTNSVSCAGSCDGSILISGTGGTGALTVELNGNVQPLTGFVAFDNLCGGTYQLIIKDGNNCQKLITAIVEEPDTLKGIVTTRPAKCFGQNNGFGSLEIVGGTPPYMFRIGGPGNPFIPYSVPVSSSTLPAGSFMLLVADANGCFEALQVVITQPTPVSVNVAVTSNYNGQNISCNGFADGTAAATPSGGTPPYVFLWDANAGSQSTAIATGLAAGTYSVSVADSNGCIATGMVTLTDPDSIVSSIIDTSIDCYGDTDAMLFVDASGGTPELFYLWDANAGNQTSPEATGLGAGTYSVTVTDVNGCSTVAMGTVAGPDSLAVSIAGTPAGCPGECNGIATANVTGGNGGDVYQWNDPASQTTQSATGLCAGIYSVVVTDVNGCTGTATVEIIEYPLPVVTVGPFSNVCASASDFVLTSGSPVGGTYSGNGVINGNFNPPMVGPGTYDIVYAFTDSNGCSASDTASITVTPNPTVNITPVNPQICAFESVQLNGNATGGSGIYTHMWAASGGTFDDATSATPIYTMGMAGSYSITYSVTDDAGCVATAMTTITVNENPTVTLSPVTTCAFVPVMIMGKNVTGGTGMYTHAWTVSGGTLSDATSPTPIYTMGIPGTYDLIVVVTDGNGCSDSDTSTVTVYDNPDVTIAPADTSACPFSDVQLNGSATGGDGTYTYSWTATGGSFDDATSATPVYTMGTPGSYAIVLTVTDGNGCSSTDTSNVTIISCVNVGDYVWLDTNMDGFADPTEDPIPGVIVMLYDDLGNLIATDTTDANGLYLFENVAPGNYYVTFGTPPGLQPTIFNANGSQITGTNGVGSTDVFTVTTMDILTVDAGYFGVGMVGDYVWFDANGDGIQDPTETPIPGVIVNLLDDMGNIIGTDTTDADGLYLFDNLLPGSYTTMVVTGAGTPLDGLVQTGGTNPSATAVLDPATSMVDLTLDFGFNCTPPTLSTVDTNPTCAGGSDGAIDLTVTGGTGTTFTYLWSNGETTEDISGLTADVYSVTVTGSTGCSASESVTLVDPPAISLTATPTDASCSGGADGSVDLTVSGGTAPYTYSWSNGETTEDISGLMAGPYDVTVTDDNGCTAAASAIVSEPFALQVSIFAEHVSCNGANDGNVFLSVDGGTPSYTFIWSNGATTQDLTNVGGGTYSVTITDANGCTEVASAVVNEPAALALSGVVTNINCNGGSDGSIDLSVSGGTTPYTYSWSGGQTTEDISNLGTGMYMVVVTDSNGCTASTSFMITEPNVISLSATTTDVLCAGGADGAIDLAAIGGTPPYTYNWSNGLTTEDISGLIAGSYTVTVTDANGCVESLTETIFEPFPLQLFLFSDPTTCNGAADGNIFTSPEGGTPPYSFAWSNGETTQDLMNVSAGVYSLTMTDANGCTISESVTVDEPAAIDINVDAMATLCVANCVGTATANPSGGTTPYTYAWNDPAGQTSQTATGLCAGTYIVTVTDFNMCFDTASVTIVESPDLTITMCPDQNVAIYGVPGLTCACESKMQEVSVIYHGSNNAAITLKKKDGTTLTMILGVNNGDTLTLNSNTYGMSDWDTKLFLKVGSGTNTEIHTSCSQEILGNTYGAFEVIGFVDGEFNTCGYSGPAPPYSGPCVCSGKIIEMSVIYDGPAGATVSVGPNASGINPTVFTNVQPGDTLSPNLGDIGNNWYWAVNGIVDATIHASCSDDILNNINSTKSNFGSLGNYPNPDQNNSDGTFLVVGHLDDDGNGCGVSGQNNFPNLPCNCEGKIVQMCVIYGGPAGATVTIGPASNGNNPTSFSNVQPGDTLTANLGNIGNDWYFAVNGSVDAQVHASCSDDILFNINSSKSDFGSLGNFPNPDQNNNNGTFLIIGHIDDKNNSCGTSNPQSMCPMVTVSFDVNGGTPPFTFLWSNGSTDSILIDNICETTIYTVTVTDANGCAATSTHTATVVNISCGDNKVTMCHDPGTSNAHTHCVDVKDIPKKLNEGYSLGDCFTDFTPGGCGPAPVPPCDCDGKIVQMSVIYDGPAGATVSVGPNSSGNNPTIFTNVQVGDTLTATLGDIGNNWYFAVNGSVNATIHASCSDDIFGNVNSTKSNFGSLGSYPNPFVGNSNGTFLVVGHADDNGNLCGVGTLPPPPCGCDGKIVQMSVIYDGPAGATVSVGPNSNGSNPTIFTNVQVGDTLTASLGDIGNNWYFAVNGSVNATIHASCSDDIFGNINSTKSNFGSLGSYPNPFVGNSNGTFLVVGHADNSGNLCGVGTLPPPPCECSGKIVQMSVIYAGPAGATVKVGPNSSGNNPTVYTNVQPGDTLTPNLGNIGNNWYWTVNGVVNADIHTSCSDDILGNINSTKSNYGSLGSYPNPTQNNNNGTFLVIRHVDENGNVCVIGQIVPKAPYNAGNSVLKPAEMNGAFLDAFPNPFSQSTTIKFTLYHNTNVTLKVFDMAGKNIATLYNGLAKNGKSYSVVFDAEQLADGMYYYRLITESGDVYTKKLVLNK